MTRDPKIGVHQTHCCIDHGCKYGDRDCPVKLGIVIQEYPCEDCDGVLPQSRSKEMIQTTLKEVNEWQANKIREYRKFIEKIIAINHDYWNDEDGIDPHASMSDINHFVKQIEKKL